CVARRRSGRQRLVFPQVMGKNRPTASPLASDRAPLLTLADLASGELLFTGPPGDRLTHPTGTQQGDRIPALRISETHNQAGIEAPVMRGGETTGWHRHNALLCGVGIGKSPRHPA